MKCRWIITFLFLFALLFNSCVIEKRHYRNGFYVNWNNSDVAENVRDTSALEFPLQREVSNTTIERIEVVVTNDVTRRKESVQETPSNDDARKTRDESPDSPVEKSDDPKPEGHDRINPLVSPLVGAAFVMPLSLLVLELVGGFGSNPYVWLIAIPLLAALLFALAMNLRMKYVTLISLGDVREKLRVSAHFHRLQILMYIYFAAAVMLSLGFALRLSASAILGWIGIIFTGGGIVVGLGVAVVLLALFALYLILWRKDPTGYKPPRNPHPPKDK